MSAQAEKGSASAGSVGPFRELRGSAATQTALRNGLAERGVGAIEGIYGLDPEGYRQNEQDLENAG